MKSRIIALMLLVSVLLNIAGLVFFILFLNLRGSYKAARRDKVRLEHNLSLFRSQNVMSTALNSEQVQKEIFVSAVDGEMDYFAFQPPSFRPNATDYTLLIYLHGMGSNYMEPFVSPAESTIASALVQHDSSVAVLSPSYRKDSSWGSDKAIADLNQNVREVMQRYPFSRIVVMGTSMGGSVALNYAAIAPEDIKTKIVGVVSVESAGDLLDLYKTSAHAGIAPALIIALGGTPEQSADIYRNKSFLHNLSQVRKNVRFYVLSAKGDRIVPAEMQKKVVSALNEQQYQTKFVEVEGNHQLPPSSYFVEGYDFALGR